jgi:sulfane dehydrogenase subunit SoxC
MRLPKSPVAIDARRPDLQVSTEAISIDELGLAGRNHSMPLEALRYSRTPIGLHYLLIHFDIPFVDAVTWRLEIGGCVKRPLRLTLDELKARPVVSTAVTLECAGNGRALLSPRPVSQPWLQEAVGTAEWSGTPLAPLLEEAGISDDAVDVVFAGSDRGIQGGVEQDYERSLSVADATRPEMILAYAMNGQPLPPQHGFPLRLLVPGWYGMAQVKWLKRITLVAEPFRGFQQVDRYRVRQAEAEPGLAVTKIGPRALMIPPGIPDFFTRSRLVDAGAQLLEGRAWSGHAPIRRVELSFDRGRSWTDANVGDGESPYAWSYWSYRWNASPGEHVLCVRATDRLGNTQPLEPFWNIEGMMNNAVQRVSVLVR